MKLNQFLGNRVTKNASWLIGGSIIHKLIAFLVGIWTARYLGPGDYGLVNYATAYTTFFFSIATLGINSILVKAFIDDPNGEGTVLGTTLVLQGVASLCSVAVIFLIACVVEQGDRLAIWIVFLSSLGLFFQVLDSVKYWFQSKLQSKYASIATIIAYVVSSLYKVILLITGKSVAWFAIATSLDYLVVAIALFAVYIRKRGPRLHFSRKTAKALLAAGFPYILSGLMVSIYGATDKLMLKHMLGEESVGYYSTAVSIANVWVFVLMSIIDSLKPVIIELKHKNELAYQRKNVQLYSIIMYLSFAVSIVITLFAGLGIDILYGDEYRAAVAPLRICTWYIAFSYLGVARDAWIVCENAQKNLFGIYVGAAATNVLLNALLIPSWGAAGAALASLVTQISTIFVVPLLIPAMRPNVKMMVDALLLRRPTRKDGCV